MIGCADSCMYRMRYNFECFLRFESYIVKFPIRSIGWYGELCRVTVCPHKPIIAESSNNGVIRFGIEISSEYDRNSREFVQFGQNKRELPGTFMAFHRQMSYSSTNIFLVKRDFRRSKHITAFYFLAFYLFGQRMIRDVF